MYANNIILKIKMLLNIQSIEKLQSHIVESTDKCQRLNIVLFS